MSRIVGTIAQQLEKEIAAATISAATTSERNTRSAIDGLRDEFMAHLDQKGAKLERQQGETLQSVEQVVAGLEELTRQLNSLKSASVDVVENLEKDLSTEVARKLSGSEQRMNLLSKSMEEPRNQLLVVLSY